MRERNGEHRRGAPSYAFDEHTMDRGSARLRRRAAWLFYDVERRFALPFEPHFRATSRAPALDSKHIRSVRRPEKAAHVKDA